MKIALLDLNHVTRGVHTNTVPFALGLIARYLQKTVEHPFEIKIFKDTRKALTVMADWEPDVLGISQYIWNSELNLHVAKEIRNKYPRCFVVAGGPNMDFSLERRIAFFKKYPFVDMCVPFDGEIPFAEMIKDLISGKAVADMRLEPVAGSYAYDPVSGRLFDNVFPAPRLTSIDVFGSIYADGFFDEFFDEGYHPHVQTHRGCPFECTYCHTSERYYSKMLFLSPEIFRKEMAYLGKRFAGQQSVTLYIGNTNMSLFNEDFKIAEIIRETQKEFSWPRIINVNCGKDPEKLLKMLSILKFEATIALQTLTPRVLEIIKRKNIRFEDFIAFMEEATRRSGEVSSTDLILSLPEETKESFIATLRKVFNSGLQSVVVNTLMSLKGTMIASEEFAARYNYLIRHRVVPRQFSEIDGKKVLDTEEVVVGTNTMSFEDYVDLRGITFTATVFFSSAELIPLKRLLHENGVDIADWVFGIHEKLSDFPDLAAQYMEFLRETRKELFLTREDLLEFFEKPENFDALRSGRLGDNLLRKYKFLILSGSYRSFLELAVGQGLKLLRSKISCEAADRLTGAILTYLSARDLKLVFEKKEFHVNRRVRLDYDVPAWIAAGEMPGKLESFPGPCDYVVKFLPAIEGRLKDLIGMNRDFELSLQILYRDGTIRDFWPIWERNEK